MNRTLSVALLLAFAAPAAVAGNGRGHDKGPPPHSNAPPHARDAARHDNGRHEGWYKQQWKRGDRVPYADIDPRYYLDDYAHYRLREPPRGYRWVRPMDDRYLLVEIATGVIAEALGY